MPTSRSPDDEKRGRVRIFAVFAAIGAALLIALFAHTLFFNDELNTAPGGAPASKTADTTNGRLAPAQRDAESTVGRSDPAGQEDATGGRARAIKGSSQASAINDNQRAKVKQVISSQQNPPRLDKADFEMMIGSAVPKQVNLQDIPPEITDAMHGYWGSQYVLVQDKLVIVDQHSRRVVAIISSVA